MDQKTDGHQRPTSAIFGRNMLIMNELETYSNPTPATTSFQKCPLSQKSHADGKSRTLTVEFNDLESIGLPLIGFFEDSGVLAAGGPSRQVDDDDLAAE